MRKERKKKEKQRKKESIDKVGSEDNENNAFVKEEENQTKALFASRTDRREREQRIINKETSTIPTRRSLSSISSNIDRELSSSTRFDERFARKRRLSSHLNHEKMNYASQRGHFKFARREFD